MKDMNYYATVTRVVDGDTVNLNIDLGFDVHLIKNCRLSKINCPELNDPDLSKRVKANEAKAFTEKLLPVGTFCQVNAKAVDNYGRPLVEIKLPGIAISVNDQIVQGGHGVPVKLQHQIEVKV